MKKAFEVGTVYICGLRSCRLLHLPRQECAYHDCHRASSQAPGSRLIVWFIPWLLQRPENQTTHDCSNDLRGRDGLRVVSECQLTCGKVTQSETSATASETYHIVQSEDDASLIFFFCKSIRHILGTIQQLGSLPLTPLLVAICNLQRYQCERSPASCQYSLRSLIGATNHRVSDHDNPHNAVMKVAAV
jgi:hypothetical protein